MQKHQLRISALINSGDATISSIARTANVDRATVRSTLTGEHSPTLRTLNRIMRAVARIESQKRPFRDVRQKNREKP